MAKFAYIDSLLYVAEFDVTGETNRVGISATRKEVPCHTFGDTWEEVAAGSRKGSVRFESYIDHSASDIDGDSFTDLGTTTQISCVPAPSSTPAIGDVAYTMKAKRSDLNVEMAFDELAMAQVAGSCDGPMARGWLAVPTPQTAVTSSFTAASYQGGSVSASQKVYAGLHVVAASGTSPTLDVVVRSDDNSGMTSPTTRLTFTQATAVTTEWQQLAGAITDDYWDVDVTIAGTSPSFTFAVVIGIGA